MEETVQVTPLREHDREGSAYGTCPGLSLRNRIGLECSGERSDAEYE